MKDGGPAFPMLGNGYEEGGMSLRDYFAGQALTQFDWHTMNPEYLGGAAKQCYAMADAMLAEREKEHNDGP